MINKIFSGRFILTVVCALVFGYCAITKAMPVDAVVSIITMVFISYFQRQDRQQKGEQQKGEQQK